MNTVSEKKHMILNDNPIKVITRLAIPLMIGNLIHTLYNITDAYWVGKLGAVEFAAISYVWPITFIFLAFSIGMTVASTSLIGQSIGNNLVDKAREIAAQFFILSLIGGVAFGLLGYLLTPYIITIMGAKGDLYIHSIDYLRIIFLEMPILFLFHVYKSMREGTGDTKSPTIFLGISVIINIILDPIFIFTLGFGVKGAAIATVLSKLCVIWLMLYRMFNKKETMHIDLSNLRLNPKIMKNLLEIGIPASIGQTVSALGFSVMNGFIVSYGDATLAAFGLGNRITSLVMMPAFGLGAALAAFIGQNIGAGQYKRAQKSVFETMAIGFILLSLGSIVIFIFRLPLINIFINDPEVVELSMSYMAILAIVFPLMAIIQSSMGAFQGSGHTKYVLILTLSRLWLLRIPMIVLSRQFTNLGSSGIWYAMLVSNFIVCIIGIVMILQGKWLKPTLKDS